MILVKNCWWEGPENQTQTEELQNDDLGDTVH